MHPVQVCCLVALAILLSPGAAAGPLEDTMNSICEKYAVTICEAVCDTSGIGSGTGEKVGDCVTMIVGTLPINE